MIALIFTAALLMDPSPKLGPVQKSHQPAVAATRDLAPAPVLSSVAVTLECTARASGRVEDCKVLGETHPGLGFGDAALALMRDAEVAPGSRDVQFARTIQFMP